MSIRLFSDCRSASLTEMVNISQAHWHGASQPCWQEVAHHEAIQGIHLPHKGALGQAPNAGIAAHLANACCWRGRHKKGLSAPSSRCSSCLTSCTTICSFSTRYIASRANAPTVTARLHNAVALAEEPECLSLTRQKLPCILQVHVSPCAIMHSFYGQSCRMRTVCAISGKQTRKP